MTKSSKERPQGHSEPAEFWRGFYRQKNTPWDLGDVAPPFVSLLHNREGKPSFFLRPGKMAVVGCGYGHDAAFFAQNGFDVFGLDYAPEAIQGAQDRYGGTVRFQEADLFNLPDDLTGQFDYVLEHTCFCAIPPTRRRDYVASVVQLLKPGGTFIGLFWADVPTDGPPFPTSNDEIRALFGSHFSEVLLTTPADSIPWRSGQERLALFHLRAKPTA